jgi:hypothetical protein
MSASGLALVAAAVFAWVTLSARLERFDVASPTDAALGAVIVVNRAVPERIRRLPDVESGSTMR